MPLVEGVALCADLLDQPVDGSEIARKQFRAVISLYCCLDQRLTEMSRQESGEREPARSLKYGQGRANSHRHDDRLTAFLKMHDRRPLRAPNRKNHCLVKAIAQLSLEPNCIP